MKHLSTYVIALLAMSSMAFAQGDLKFPGLDKSPVDIAIYSVEKQPVAKVIYGRPQKKGREVFGGLVSYGKVWRTGANEAAEITFYRDVTLGDKQVSAGTYALFTIPGEEEWTVILNSQLNQWGSYGYDQSKDVARATAKVADLSAEVEAFAIVFSNDGMLTFAWDKTMAQVAIK